LLLSIDSESVFQQASSAYPHVYVVAAAPQVYRVLPADLRTPVLTDFVRLWAKHEPNLDPTNGATGWDAIYLIAQAIRSAGTTAGGPVRAALEHMSPFAGAIATYRFTTADHYGISQNPYFLVKWTTSGPEIVIGPHGS
jgi:ABC-type branched-subunit amino acid transport system substrate-binding protein